MINAKGRKVLEQQLEIVKGSLNLIENKAFALTCMVEDEEIDKQDAFDELVEMIISAEEIVKESYTEIYNQQRKKLMKEADND